MGMVLLTVLALCLGFYVLPMLTRGWIGLAIAAIIGSAGIAFARYRFAAEASGGGNEGTNALLTLVAVSLVTGVIAKALGLIMQARGSSRTLRVALYVALFGVAIAAGLRMIGVA